MTPKRSAKQGAGPKSRAKPAKAPKKPPAPKKKAPKGSKGKAAAKQPSPRKKAPAKTAERAMPPRAGAKKAPASPKEAKAKPADAVKEAVPAKKSVLERRPPARKPGSVICPLSGFEVMPQTANLAPRTVERLRRKLVDERERHLRQAEELQAEAEALAMERDPGDTQFDEESGEGDTVNVERERDLLLSASARQIVEAIDRALERMDGGTYGLCVPAGRRIAVERLEAIPYAEECVDCKARAERRR
jgi:RNA polymerase-binding transcription factor DksA